MHYTIYILNQLSWILPELLSNNLLLTLLSNGLLLNISLYTCQIAYILHYIYSKTSWVVKYKYQAYYKGVGMQSQYLQFSLLVLVYVLVRLLMCCTIYILKLTGQLDVGIRHTIKGQGYNLNIYSPASWCWFAYYKGVGI